MPNPFIWTNLSTFDTAAACGFYKAVFGWRFTNDGGYHYADLNGEPVAALLEMPGKLQALNLPSFWMSYVQVPDLEAAVARAEAIPGTIVEVRPTDFGADARIALVRDPAGAGFTMYQGPALAGRRQAPGWPCWTVHHSGDIAMIQPFYETVLGWQFHPNGTNTAKIVVDGNVVAHAERIPDATRGRYTYWMPIFGVASVADTRREVTAQGGTDVWNLGDGRHMLADPQGATFLVQEA